MRRTWLVSAIVIGALVVSSVALARGPHRRGGRGMGMGKMGGPGPMAMLQRLDLSEEQQAAVDALFEEHRAVVEPLRTQMEALHEEVKAVLEADGLLFDEAEALQDQKFELRKALRAERRKFHRGLVGILTAEQLAQLPKPWVLGFGKPGPGMHEGPGFRGGRGFGPMGPGRGACDGSGPCGGWGGPPPPADGEE